jgi:DNA-binding NarL/FixJ family response regulator
VDMQLKEAKEILSQVRIASPDSRIIILTMFDNLHYLQALSKLGVAAYLHKSSSSEELLAAIDTLSRNPGGDNVVVSLPRDFLERLGDDPPGTLSERETEILVLAARGFSNHQIATQLRLSEATVKRHLANVYGKLAVGSRSEAVRKALTQQWIGLHEITSAVSPDGSDDLDGSHS